MNFQINHDAESTTSKMGIFALQLSTGSQRKERKGIKTEKKNQTDVSSVHLQIAETIFPSRPHIVTKMFFPTGHVPSAVIQETIAINKT